MRRALFALLLAAATAVAPAAAQDRDFGAVLAALEDDDSATRREARGALTELIDAAEGSAREELVGRLIAALRGGSYHKRVGIAGALAVVRPSWRAPAHDDARKLLYEAYKSETDGTLRSALDRALVNAQGLYRDAIANYNEGSLDERATVAAFKLVEDEFKESSYAPRAAFFLASYYNRLAYLKKDPLYFDRADEQYEKLLKGVTGGYFSTTTDLYLDALYYKALNLVSMGNREKALATLREITESAGAGKLPATSSETGVDRAIYVYQYFYNLSVDATIVDRWLSADALAEYTSRYLQNNEIRLNDAKVADARWIEAFEKDLWAFEGGDVFVVVSSTKTEKEAEERKLEFEKSLKEKNEDLKVSIYPPYQDNTYWAVVVGEFLSDKNAVEIRDRAVAAGLPADAYLWDLSP